MDLLTKDQLAELAQRRSAPCISLLMPTFHVEAELAQNPIRLKNLVKRLRQQLKEQGYRDPQIDELVAPVLDLFGQNDFWLHQSDGLAIYLAPGFARVYRVPLSLDELVVVGRHFHLKPLFPLLVADQRFYVLALNQHNVRLYEGTRYRFREVKAADIPRHIAEVVGDEVLESTMRLGIRQAGSGGRANQAMYHGHGLDPEDEKAEPHDEIKRFFREVNDGLRRMLDGETAPLVLAGVEYYLPIYRSVNDYPHLVDHTLIRGAGSDQQKPQELQQKAWKIVEPIFQEERRRAVEQFRQLIGVESNLVSEDLTEIVPAAVFSRVDTLFIPKGVHKWGHYDEASNALEIHDEPEAGDEDLFGFAALHTFLHGGTVYVVPPDEMPGKNGLAATFRYPADVAAEAR